MGEIRFYIVNEDVCIRLRLHGEDIKNLLRENNWLEVKDIKKADVIFVNTCAFLKKAEDRAIRRIQKIIKKKKRNQEVIVFGCLPQINPQRLKKIHQVASFSRRDLSEVIQKFQLKEKEVRIGHKVVRKGPILARILKYSNRALLKDDYFTYLYDKKKVFHLKIAEGCLGICTYCSERFARGFLKSKKISDIIEEFKTGLKEGYRIFSFNADDVGVFGQDNNENISLLLEEILKIEGDYRLVLTEFNPWGLVKYKKNIVSLLSSPKIIFITVPLESGSQKILKLMRRPYRINNVFPILSDIRRNNSKIKINTHIIVGFPGESEEDFKETIGLFDRFHFNKVKVFKYSERPGTLSSTMPNKISEAEKERRHRILCRKVLRKCIRTLNLKEFLLNWITF